jgi:sugar O-acyltransferase (sialic acid O-acetyltransferase NeuD family)
MEQAAQAVRIPLLNPNEPEAKVVHLAVQEGQFVSKDSVLCILETTKSTAEVVAEIDGYIISLQVAENDLAEAGSLLCYLAKSAEWQPTTPVSNLDGVPGPGEQRELDSSIPEGLRISQPALNLARNGELDLSQLPIGPMVTTNMVEELLKQSTKPALQSRKIDPKKLVVYGGGGHGKSVIDAIRSQSIYEIHGIIDDGLKLGDQVLDISILGGSEVLPKLYQQGIGQAVNAVGGIGDIKSRTSVFELISDHGFTSPTVIHASAVVEPSADISSGVQVFPHAYVGSDASIGFGVIVNTSAVVSHDCRLAQYVNISPGALLAGGVAIGYGTLIGMGVTINLGVKIGENVRIGNSATIKSDVPDGSLVKAGMIWPE